MAAEQLRRGGPCAGRRWRSCCQGGRYAAALRPAARRPACQPHSCGRFPGPPLAWPPPPRRL